MAKKLPSEITTEELLSILEQEDEVVETSTVSIYGTDVLEFFSFYNIRKGTDSVSKPFLYRLYKLWSNAPVRVTLFRNEAARYLDGNLRNHYVNQDVFQLSKRAQEILDKGKRDRTKKKPYKAHFESFLKEYDIKSADDNYVTTSTLFFFYDEWTYKNKKKHGLSWHSFNNFCKLYFKQKRLTDDTTRWYGINDSISKDRLNIAKEWAQKYDGKKEKNKKKQD